MFKYNINCLVLLVSATTRLRFRGVTYCVRLQTQFRLLSSIKNSLMAEDRTPACCLRPVRQKTIEGSVIQSDFVNVPKKFDSHIFISRSKACYLGRKPSTSKVAGDFKACVPEAWQSVSALHAILRWKDGKVTIEDRSSNGSWVGRAGKGAGESEEDFKRLDKNKAEEVAMDSYVMLAQWPSGRKAEDVLMCDQMLSCVSTGSERPICSRSYL